MIREIVAVVPARGGSKGIKDKNLTQVGSLSLLERAINAGLNSQLVKTILITSDSEKVLKHARDFVSQNLQSRDKEFIFHKRSSSLASDSSLISETLKAIFNQYSLLFSNDTGILLLQPTSPFRRKMEVDEFLKFTYSSGSFRPGVSVKEVSDSHPARMYVLNSNNTLRHSGYYQEEEFYPRQSLSKLFLRDGAFYLLNKKMIEMATPVTEDSMGFRRIYPYTINIDSQSDLELARLEFENISHEL
jgi:CMP-N,N'-diacetyllegionaminic acid synthase